MEKDPNAQDQDPSSTSEMTNNTPPSVPVQVTSTPEVPSQSTETAPEAVSGPDSDEPTRPTPLGDVAPPVVPLSEPAPAFTPSPVFASVTPEPPVTTPVTEPVPPTPKSPVMRYVLSTVVGLIVVGILSLAAYLYGNNHGYTNGKNDQVAASMAAELKVPTNATMISQCTAGEGTQYVQPSNIPQGPIYNVWQGKVTGIEYMVAQSNIASAKAQNLTLMGQQFNHTDIMYEAAGHAGFTEPHYHLIFSLISYADEQKITCSGSSSSTTMGM
jgi:hypothetical protein